MISLGHSTVLLNEAIAALDINASGIYVDGTFGRGGHSREILKQLGSAGRLWVIDKDPLAIAVANQLSSEDKRVAMYSGSFADMAIPLGEQGLSGKVDGILLDLGVSSPQIDDPQRGFSFMHDGPLDMRMNPEAGLSAAEWLNEASLEEIAEVLKTYGEERFGRRIATEIVRCREQQAINTTKQLVAIIERAMPVKDKHKHPATRTFQGIRIFINRELDDLKRCLNEVIDLLAVGGKLVVISFHSLEDRIVKRFMRDQSRGDQYPAGLAIPDEQLNRRLKIVGKAVKASPEEVARNPRARSAVLRVAEKLS